jgi:hypothetical protein
VGDRLGWLGAPGDSLAHWSEWEACAAADIGAGLALAHESIDSGAAKERLEALVAATAAVDPE